MKYYLLLLVLFAWVISSDEESCTVSDQIYGFKCYTTVYFCGLNSSVEVIRRKADAVFGGQYLGIVDYLYALYYPDCSVGCLPKICPNYKDMDFYFQATCEYSTIENTTAFTVTDYQEITRNVEFPICIPPNTNESGLVNFSNITALTSNGRSNDLISIGLILTITIFLVLVSD